ncbi:porin [Mesorhizobium sp. LMG 17147]|uniref:porin n=1 Tax=Mesorhizobium sp. LMG 17147 TaxID=2963091 RepID=UPI0020C9C380|nr:porin [Mesorhizobium sp. LMG 17147]MCP9233266.1 porin [Mesorhizobium sp. LMG 17147]
MNIKSLLLGSAAALIAVSGARAADAVVVAEPEPAEYVKICDVYGAGYFYIPGTETCLRIGGYVRYDIGIGDVGSFDGAKTTDQQDGDSQDTYYKHARFTLKTWTGQETEMGTLKTYTETRFNWGNHNDYLDDNFNGGTSVSLNFAWVQLGGLRVGKDESAFDTFIGYAGNVIQDTLVPYGGFDTNVVQYYFDAGNGFSAVASLETGSGSAAADPGLFQDSNSGNDSIDSYVPYVVGGIKYTQGWGSITGVAAYDSTWEEWAGKVRVDVTPIQNLTLFIMAGYGSDDNIDRNFYKQWGGNWAVWGGGTYTINEKTSFNLQASADDDKNYGVAANIAYDIVPGLTITAEVDWARDGQFDKAYDRNWTNADDKDSVGGMLRFQRSF